MRSLKCLAAAAVVAVGLLAVAPSSAEAQFFRRGYAYNYAPAPVYSTPYYGPYYAAPPVYSYSYTPGYTPGYYWSGRYYANPYSRGYYYQQYSPWTNTYYYNYRVAPWGF
jgi:hypothetical protein